MGVPNIYRKSPSAVASYDYFDIASGTGIKTFYAGDVNSTVANTAGEYILQPNQFYSDVGATTIASTSTADVDFDVVLNRPLNVKGDCSVNVPLLLVDDNGAGNEDITVTAKLRKWDGTTETEIASDTAIHGGNPDQNDGMTLMYCIKFSISSVVHFKKGETLRLTIQTSAPDSDHHAVLGHDPMGRLTVDDTTGTDAWETTTALTLNLPIVVDV